MYEVVVRTDDGDDVLVGPNIFPAVPLNFNVVNLALLLKCPFQRFIELCSSDLFLQEKIVLGPIDHFLDQFFFSHNVGLFLFENDVLGVKPEAD